MRRMKTRSGKGPRAEAPPREPAQERIAARGAPQSSVEPTDVPRNGDRQQHSTKTPKAFGITSSLFLDGLLAQIAGASAPGGKVDKTTFDFMCSVVFENKPKDCVEAMLLAQMTAVHVAAMSFAGRLANVDSLAQQDSAERAYNKLSQTFVSQVEALKRHRTGGEQKVTVQHVSVSEGGQAIVGNVTQTAGAGTAFKAADSPSAITNTQPQPMPIVGENIDQCFRVYAAGPRLHRWEIRMHLSMDSIPPRLSRYGRQIQSLVQQARKTLADIK